MSHNLAVIGALFAVAVGLALLSRVPLRTLAVREWIGVFAFTGLLALPAIFITPGEVIYRLPALNWPITAQGVRSALYLITRVETAATLALLLILCTPWTQVLKALRVLRVPVVLVVILGMTYRYIFLLLQTAHDLFEARRSRMVGPLDGAANRRLAAASAGVLLSKSLHLSGEVYLALDDLTLQIEAGQRVAILGANGSGKSTFLRLLDALYFVERGSLCFDGEPLTEARLQEDEFAFAFRRRVGLVFQNPDVQLFNPTVFDEVAFGPLQLRWPKEQILQRVAQILERMEIAHLKDRSPHRLSGGEKKRVALACVLVLDPEVLLLDESTTALDPKSQSQMIDFLSEWSGVKTIVTATHDLDIVEEIADRCFVFQQGRVVADAPPSEILRDEALLRQTNLIHSHRHRHEPGVVHSHPHLHQRHDHPHPKP